VEKTSSLAPAAMIEKGLLIADVNPLLDAERVFAPERLTMRLLKVASPAASVTCERVPVSVPVPDASAMVTVTPAFRTLLPLASFSWTVTAGDIGLPAVVVVGC